MVKNGLFYTLFATVLFVLVVPSSGNDLFSSIFKMGSLMETHKYVARQLSAVIEEEQRFLDSIKRLVEEYEEEQREAQNDINKYLGNPLNSFSLIKQLTVGLDDIKKMFNGSVERMRNITLVKEGLQYPSDDDLTGAATAMGKLQEFYKLNTKDLAAGYIYGEKKSRELSFDDCMSLARRLYTDDYPLAISWMEEALRKYKQIEDVNVHFINDMQNFIAFSYYQLGDLESAQEWTLKILKLEPNDIRAISNLKHYQRVLEQRKQNQAVYRSISNKDDSKQKEFNERYHGVCRGDFELLPNVTKSLKCYYLDENHAFLKIAPFKIEQLYDYPKAYIVHNAITNDEIDLIKNISAPRMARAKVVLASGVGGYSEHRTSQITWIDDSVHPRVAAISRRASHFTGLCTASAEELQVGNYGIGGHNNLHNDYDWHDDKTTSWEDRFSTALFYLSDVERGGATAFPHLGLAVFPKKGSALVWHNLHPSGEGNKLTRHAGCPVLLGDKWVANKWISSTGQEQRWPCHLDREYGLDVKPLPFRLKLPNFASQDCLETVCS